MTRGQFTFVIEGHPINEANTRTIHHPWNRLDPNNKSGVTIGRGYDMGQRDRDTIIRDLIAAEIPDNQARMLAGAARLTHNLAANFVHNNKDSPWATITEVQERQLFENIYSVFAEEVESRWREIRPWGIRFENGIERMYPYQRSFDDLSAHVQDVAVDIAYNVGLGGFFTANWGGIFQMADYAQMADYIEGEIKGDIILTAGGQSTGIRAEDSLAGWRVTNKGRRLPAILERLRSQTEPQPEPHQ